MRGPDIAPGTVDAFTESVDVMSTVLDWIGLPLPTQADGRSLLPWLKREAPADWCRHAHWEFDFRDPRKQRAERHFGLSPDLCNLTVLRGAAEKYVHFAACRRSISTSPPTRTSWSTWPPTRPAPATCCAAPRRC